MRLLWRLGFSVSDMPPPFQQLATTVADAAHALDSLPDPPSPQDLAHLLEQAKGIYDAIQELGSGPAPNGADATAYAEEIGERLFELLLTDYLAAEQPQAFNILSMLRVITDRDGSRDGDASGLHAPAFPLGGDSEGRQRSLRPAGARLRLGNARFRRGTACCVT